MTHLARYVPGDLVMYDPCDSQHYGILPIGIQGIITKRRGLSHYYEVEWLDAEKFIGDDMVYHNNLRRHLHGDALKLIEHTP